MPSGSSVRHEDLDGARGRGRRRVRRLHARDLRRGRATRGLPRSRRGHHDRRASRNRERRHPVSRPPAGAHGRRPGGGRRRPPFRRSGRGRRHRRVARNRVADQLSGLLLGGVGSRSPPCLSDHHPYRHPSAGGPPERPLPPRQSGSDMARGWQPVGLSRTMAASGPRSHPGSVAARRGHGRNQRRSGFDGRSRIRRPARYRDIG